MLAESGLRPDTEDELGGTEPGSRPLAARTARLELSGAAGLALTGRRAAQPPLRRWYGVMFAVIGLADTITASITGDFAGGVIGRVAGHSFLLAGLFIILLALPLLATANTRRSTAGR